jgi:hypothetical protein
MRRRFNTRAYSTTPTPMTKHLITRVLALCMGLSATSSYAANFVLKFEATNIAPSTRGQSNTTYFGWDKFDIPAAGTDQWLDDSTPDMFLEGQPVTGARFLTTNQQKHWASSQNFYAGATPTAAVAERVTVPTNGTPGETGTTTIIAQLVSGSGNFASTWTFSPIEGQTPVVLHAMNGDNKGQVWVKWVVPGNKATYDFTIGAVSSTHMGFDKIEVDTSWSATSAPHPDTVVSGSEQIVMETLSGAAAPSSRGTPNTTYFGWDSFGVAGDPPVIDDSTPDIGTYSGILARFRTTNGELHKIDITYDNLYWYSGGKTLAEEITVPTSGTVGDTGVTTVFLQILSANSTMGGDSFGAPFTVTLDLPDPENPGTFVPTAPKEAVVAGNSIAAHYWAKWEIPGNKSTYTINISGPTGQAHYSFDKVVVDTKFHAKVAAGDTMRATMVDITTATLAATKKGTAYSQQLAATGGVAPYSWTLNEGDVLPAGLALSTSGLISGTPTAQGPVEFTVVATSSDSFQKTRTYTLNPTVDIIVATNSLPRPAVGQDYSFELSADLGEAPYAWTVETGSQLPVGLFLSSAGVISGKPTAAGVLAFTVRVTDADASYATKELSLDVSADLLPPQIVPETLAPISIGSEFDYTVKSYGNPKQFSVVGLPKGMKVDTATGKITGRTTLPGVYVLQIRAANAAGSSSTVTTPLIVQALAGAHVGNFTGIISRETAVNGNLGSVFNLTTTTTGSYTVKVKSGSATKSAKGFLGNGVNQVSVDVGGAVLALTLANDGTITGTHGAATVEGWRQVWDKKFNPASSYEGYYSTALVLPAPVGEAPVNLAIPQGTGYTTFTVASAGTLKITGKTADGQTITSSTTLGPDGEIAVYATLYGNKGTLVGVWSVDSDGTFINNNVEGELTWSKPETKGRTYVAPFGPVALDVAGSYLGVTAKGPVALGLPEAGAINIEFEGGGVEASNTVANVTGAVLSENYTVSFPTEVANAAKVALKVTKGSGAVSGSFTLTETTPALVRKGIKFQGQVVRLPDAETKVVGYFLLPQIPAPGDKPTSSPILSGSFFITQPVAP